MITVLSESMKKRSFAVTVNNRNKTPQGKAPCQVHTFRFFQIFKIANYLLLFFVFDSAQD